MPDAGSLRGGEAAVRWSREFPRGWGTEDLPAWVLPDPGRIPRLDGMGPTSPVTLALLLVVAGVALAGERPQPLAFAVPNEPTARAWQGTAPRRSFALVMGGRDRSSPARPAGWWGVLCGNSFAGPARVPTVLALRKI
jgi:hypothetical protein